MNVLKHGLKQIILIQKYQIVENFIVVLKNTKLYMPSVKVVVDHSLNRDDAKERIKKIFDKLKEDFQDFQHCATSELTMALLMAGLGNRGQGLFGREKSCGRRHKQYATGVWCDEPV